MFKNPNPEDARSNPVGKPLPERTRERLLDAAGGGGSAERRLSRFVLIFLLRILDEGRPAWFGKLMAREIVEPSGALDRVIDRAILPLHHSLWALGGGNLRGGAVDGE